jgi:hypothetical protein
MWAPSLSVPSRSECICSSLSGCPACSTRHFVTLLLCSSRPQECQVQFFSKRPNKGLRYTAGSSNFPYGAESSHQETRHRIRSRASPCATEHNIALFLDEGRVHSHEIAVPERRKYIVHEALEWNARVNTLGCSSLVPEQTIWWTGDTSQETIACIYMDGQVNNIKMQHREYCVFGALSIVRYYKATKEHKVS